MLHAQVHLLFVVALPHGLGVEQRLLGHHCYWRQLAEVAGEHDFHAAEGQAGAAAALAVLAVHRVVLGVPPLRQPLVNASEHQLLHHRQLVDLQNRHAAELFVQLGHVALAQGSQLSEKGVPAAQAQQRLPEPMLLAAPPV